MNFSKELQESVLNKKLNKIRGKLEQSFEISSKFRVDSSQLSLNKLMDKMITKTKKLESNNY